MHQAVEKAQGLGDSRWVQTPLYTHAQSSLLSETPVIETAPSPTGWDQNFSDDGERDKPAIIVDSKLHSESDTAPPQGVESYLHRYTLFFETAILNTAAAIACSLSRIIDISIDTFSQPSLRSTNQTIAHWLEASLPLWIGRQIRFWFWLHEKLYRWDPADQKRIIAQSGSLGENGDEIPDYVLEYAPFVHLFTGEHFWPCDPAEHLIHTTPYVNYTVLGPRTQHPSLSDLDELNFWHGPFVFLTSDDDPEDSPPWLRGEKNIPSSPDHALYPGTTTQAEKQEPFQNQAHENLGKSDAAAVLIVADKGDGIVDAFWFYFYSFNLGNSVLNVRFGNHVGDWEHSAVRFHNGTPHSIFLSEHSSGAAYTYEAIEKRGKRPVIYSAVGTHAMYATPGLHPYVLPWGLLHDQTDRGPLWDPALNLHAYTYESHKDILRASTLTSSSPTEWFNFAGHWGDKAYPLSDPRQYQFAGQYHYVGGPLGPRFKDLGRKNICPSHEKPCIIRHWIGDTTAYPRPWPGMDEDQEAGMEDLA